MNSRYTRILSFCLSITFCLSYGALFSQEGEPIKKHRSIRYYVGVQNLRANAETLSNLTYSGLAIPLRAGYKVEDSLRRHLVLFDYTNFKLTNEFNKRELDGPFVSAEYHYVRRIRKMSSSVQHFFLGGYVKGNTLARGITSDQFVVSAHDTYFSIGPSIGYSRWIGYFHKLDFQASMPLVSFVDDRLSGFSNSDRFVFANKLIDYRFEMEYTFKPNNVTSFLLNYNFNYYNVARSQDAASHAGHTFLIGFFIQI